MCTIPSGFSCKWPKPNEGSDDATSAVWAFSYLCVSNQKHTPLLAFEGFVTEFLIFNYPASPFMPAQGRREGVCVRARIKALLLCTFQFSQQALALTSL